jgi:tRNA-specific 2-thiouridylase
MIREKQKKVLVAMSGGVDSSVAVLILKKQGYEVAGAYMKNWSDSSFFKDKRMCPWEDDLKDAKKVAVQLGIPFYTFNFENEYREKVVEYMINGYRNGITPNPDVMCNKEIKFKLFLKKAMSMGFDFIATGHYAQIKKSESEYRLLAGKDKNKDQSYFLWTLGQAELSHTLFPLGGYEKPRVREIAKEAGLINAEKKDSQGICFVGEINVFEFLKSQIPAHKGKIITEEGRVVGEHEGVEFYTIGQRHGIGSPGGGVAFYVVKKDAEKNILYVAESDKDEKLYKKELLAKGISWVSGKEPELPLKCLARIRYRQVLSECEIMKEDEKTLKVKFNKPQKAVAPGQSIVFYDDDTVFCGAIIV